MYQDFSGPARTNGTTYKGRNRNRFPIKFLCRQLRGKKESGSVLSLYRLLLETLFDPYSKQNPKQIKGHLFLMPFPT